MSTISTDHGFVTIRARFPRAQAVFLLGEFNNWSTSASPMTPVGSGYWEFRLRASQRPGTPYFFVWEYGKPFGRLVRHDGSLRHDGVLRHDGSPARPIIEAMAG